MIEVTHRENIFPEYRDTPIGDLLEYHNLGKSFNPFTKANLLIGMCMDHRITIRIPEQFAYIIRTGGADLRFSEFKVSYAIAVGGISHLALIGHNNCGMRDLISHKDRFVAGLVERGGWKKEAAEEHFREFAPRFEIGDEVEFVRTETGRLRKMYPKIFIAPLLYNTKNNRLYLIAEKNHQENP